MKLNTQWNWRKVTYLPAFAWVPMKRRALLSLAARGTVCSEISAAGQLAENWSRLSVVFWLSWAFRLPSSLQVLLPLFLKERNTLLYMWCINELSIKYLHNAVIFPGYTIYFREIKSRGHPVDKCLLGRALFRCIDKYIEANAYNKESNR